jgi:uncharacterized protein DUF4011
LSDVEFLLRIADKLDLEIGLDPIRTRLLDLTNRNKLLNYRYPTASSLRVVGASIDEVYVRLRDNEKVAFVPVLEPDLDTDDFARYLSLRC